MTQVYHALYGNNSRSLILLIAWLPSLVSILFLRTLRIIKVVKEKNDAKIFYNLLYISLGLAGFLMVIVMIQNRVTFTRLEYGATSFGVLILLFAPFGIVIKEELDQWKSKKRQLLNDPSEQLKVFPGDLPLAVELAPPPAEQVELPLESESGTTLQKWFYWTTKAFTPPERGEDFTILQAFFSIDMLLIFLATACGMGGTLTAIDNLGQIGKSLGYPTSSIPTFVSLVSIWNYLGRVGAGFSSEIFLKDYKFPRPLMLTLVLLLSCIGHLLIAFGVPNSIYISSVIIGFCLGAQNPLLFAIISEIFGLKYYSTLFQIGAMASPVGAYVLNVKVAGHLYDKEATRQMAAKGLIRPTGEELTCTGVVCYRLTFIIVTAVTIFGSLISLILVLRTNKFYKNDVHNKLKKEGEIYNIWPQEIDARS